MLSTVSRHTLIKTDDSVLSGNVQHLYTCVFMRQTLYHVIGTSCNCFAPRSMKQPAGSNPLAHKYMPTFIRTEYQTMIFIIWLIIQLLQLQMFATVLTVLVALHDTMYYICTTEALEDASENAIATNLGVFTAWNHIWSSRTVNVTSYVHLSKTFPPLRTSGSVWDA